MQIQNFPLFWQNFRRRFSPTATIPAVENNDKGFDHLRHLPKGTHATVNFSGREFRVTDTQSFTGVYDAYFRRSEYAFPVECKEPLVIDCGANVGVTVHYWKQLCPDARIIAFEPDPEAFAALSFNCAGLSDVILKQAAVWTMNGSISFTAVGSDGGHLSVVAARTDSVKQIDVKAVRLRDFIVEPVELLKMDIEGSEVDVLSDCADRLSLVKRMFVEYHSFINKPQRLYQLFHVIEQAGFRIHAHHEMPASQPFISRPVFNEKDFRLNIFCFRI